MYVKTTLTYEPSSQEVPSGVSPPALCTLQGEWHCEEALSDNPRIVRFRGIFTMEEGNSGVTADSKEIVPVTVRDDKVSLETRTKQKLDAMHLLRAAMFVASVCRGRIG